MKNLTIKGLLLLSSVLVITSCRKNNGPEPEIPEAERAGVYVLNQGNFGASNSTLTYYDYTGKTLTADKFNAENGVALGATANDVQVYGSKMYIVVNVSSKVEVADAKTVKSIKTIQMKDGSVNRQPRYIVFHEGKGYISSYDGTVAVLDTATLSITRYINVGRNPEQMAVANGKLYVANSGGLDFGNPDNTVSVIDLTTYAEKKITVVANPVSVAADKYGDVYVISNGNYIDVNPSMTIINSSTDAVKQSAEANVGYGSPIAINDDLAYIIAADGKIRVYNVKTETDVNGDFGAGTDIGTPYAIAADVLTGEVFVTDAVDYSSNGKLIAFDKDGKFEYSITTGVNPGSILFVNK